MSLFWNKKYGKDKICGITQTRLRAGKNKYGQGYAVFLPCKHGFYRSVLLSWIINSTNRDLTFSCPLCRQRFNSLLYLNITNNI